MYVNPEGYYAELAKASRAGGIPKLSRLLEELPHLVPKCIFASIPIEPANTTNSS